MVYTTTATSVVNTMHNVEAVVNNFIALFMKVNAYNHICLNTIQANSKWEIELCLLEMIQRIHQGMY